MGALCRDGASERGVVTWRSQLASRRCARLGHEPPRLARCGRGAAAASSNGVHSSAIGMWWSIRQPPCPPFRRTIRSRSKLATSTSTVRNILTLRLASYGLIPPQRAAFLRLWCRSTGRRPAFQSVCRSSGPISKTARRSRSPTLLSESSAALSRLHCLNQTRGGLIAATKSTKVAAIFTSTRAAASLTLQRGPVAIRASNHQGEDR